jgi:hypothetical protein
MSKSFPRATSDNNIHREVDTQDSYIKFNQEIVLTKDQFGTLEDYFQGA